MPDAALPRGMDAEGRSDHRVARMTAAAAGVPVWRPYGDG